MVPPLFHPRITAASIAGQKPKRYGMVFAAWGVLLCRLLTWSHTAYNGQSATAVFADVKRLAAPTAKVVLPDAWPDSRTGQICTLSLHTDLSLIGQRIPPVQDV